MEGPGQRAPSLAEIERVARDAIARLPAPFAAHLEGVLLIFEEFADDAVLNELGIEDPFALSGLYSGKPIGMPSETCDAPATIHLYRRAILDEWCETGEALNHLIAHVVIHEVGHHFGLSDDDMHALESGA